MGEKDLCKLFVRGVTAAMSDADVLKTFAAHGEIVRYTKSLQRGFAFITFTEPKAAFEARLYVHDIAGQPVKCHTAYQDRSVPSDRDLSATGSASHFHRSQPRSPSPILRPSAFDMIGSNRPSLQKGLGDLRPGERRALQQAVDDRGMSGDGEDRRRGRSDSRRGDSREVRGSKMDGRMTWNSRDGPRSRGNGDRSRGRESWRRSRSRSRSPVRRTSADSDEGYHSYSRKRDYSPRRRRYSPSPPSYGRSSRRDNSPRSPRFRPSSPHFSPSSPQYSLASPQFSPPSPSFIIASPQFSPASPHFEYSPPVRLGSPSFSPAVPALSLGAPAVDLSLRRPPRADTPRFQGSSPALGAQTEAMEIDREGQSSGSGGQQSTEADGRAIGGARGGGQREGGGQGQSRRDQGRGGSGVEGSDDGGAVAVGPSQGEIFINERCRLAVRNLSKVCSADSLRSVAEEYGRVTAVVVHRYFLGEGMLEYSTMDEADEALRGLNGRLLHGLTVRLQRF